MRRNLINGLIDGIITVVIAGTIMLWLVALIIDAMASAPPY